MHGGLKAGGGRQGGGVTHGSASTCHAGPDLIKGIVWESSASLTAFMSPVSGKQLIYYRTFQEGQNQRKTMSQESLILQHPGLLEKREAPLSWATSGSCVQI